MIFDGKEGEGIYGNKQQICLYADLLKSPHFFIYEKVRAFLLHLHLSACTGRNIYMLPVLETGPTDFL